MPSSRICHGVSKSGSPTPKEIASFISLTISKNLRIPEGFISTTLSGYTLESLSDSTTPDYELLKNLIEKTHMPVILEGRIWSPEDVTKAFKIGAHAVVIGSEITRPQLITKRFIER